MSFRFRKSFGSKAFRVNLSKSGLGVSTGIKGFRASVGPRGTRLTASIPGTGISYVKESRNKRKTNHDDPFNFRDILPPEYSAAYDAVPLAPPSQVENSYRNKATLTTVGALLPSTVILCLCAFGGSLTERGWAVLVFFIVASIACFAVAGNFKAKAQQLEKQREDQRSQAVSDFIQRLREAEEASRQRMIAADAMSVDKLAEIATAYFGGNGAVVSAVGAQNDRVILAIERNGERKAIFVQRSFKPVGTAEVRTLYEFIMKNQYTTGYLITNDTYTLPAKKFIEGKPLQLLDEHDLEEIMRTNEQIKALPAPEQPVETVVSNDPVERAIQAAANGDRRQARQYLFQAVKENPQNIRAWFLLSQVVDEQSQAIDCLNRVIKINPDNQQARRKLAVMEGERRN